MRAVLPINTFKGAGWFAKQMAGSLGALDARPDPVTLTDANCAPDIVGQTLRSCELVQ